ncbi:MAG: hypothetical protein GC138_05845 [Gammaproteobacteria bacterium]|nr:hypothetical protein [Gammaproteobacteria bacterium]
MAESRNFDLIQDRRGLVWDLLLYVPTVIALAMYGAYLWYSADHTWAYLLFFMASFFFITGANRILVTRLMLLPKAPVGLSLGRDSVALKMRNGDTCSLIKDVRFFSDYAGKSFGLSGLEGDGQKRQFVFHRGQFSDDGAYQDLLSRLRIYK